METILHLAIKEEFSLGLIDAKQFLNAYRKVNEFLEFSYIPPNPNYSPLAHKAKFEEVAEYLRTRLPINRFCDYERIIETPRWQLSKALLNIRPPDGYCPLSQLEAVIVWMSIAQKYNLPIYHCIADDGRRIITWDTGTIRYTAYPVSGVVTDKYRSPEPSPAYNNNSISYLYGYYSALLASEQGKHKIALKKLEGLGQVNSPELEDFYFINLYSYTRLRTDLLSKNLAIDIAKILEKSVNKFPNINTYRVIVNLLILVGETEQAEKWLRNKISSANGQFLHPLHELLAEIYRSRGDEIEAENILKQFQELANLQFRSLMAKD